MSVLHAPASSIADDIVQSVVVAADDGVMRDMIVDALRPLDLTVRGASRADSSPGGEPAPDLLVFHCHTLGPDELVLLRELKDESDGVRIVVVCAMAGSRNTRRAVDSGVDGLVFADRLQASLAPTVAAVLAGQRVVPSQLGASVRKESLSFREKQILGMVAMGFTNGQIGSRLFLAESTIKSHLSSAFTKLGVGSRSEAAALVLDPREAIGIGVRAVAEPPAQASVTRRA